MKPRRIPRFGCRSYQQRPTDEQGTFWKREWLSPGPGHSGAEASSIMKVYMGSDYAVTKGGGDWTVHAVLGIDAQDRPWLLDFWRGRTASDVWVAAWCELVAIGNRCRGGEERGQIISGVGPWLEREALVAQGLHGENSVRVSSRQRRDEHRRSGVTSRTADCTTMRILPERAALEAELLAFPAGKNDDMHDALGLVGQLLDMATKGRIPAKRKPKIDSGYRATGTKTHETGQHQDALS